MPSDKTIAPGARIVVRDAEWLVRKVDNYFRDTREGPKPVRSISAVGISEIVRDKEAIFIDEIEDSYGRMRTIAEPGIEVLDPADTKLVPDTSSEYRKTILYIESNLRRIAPSDSNLYVGHKAAMDPLDYQLEPALLALKQPRQRILIADAVGLGKTLEAGILVSELIKRGRGRRMLVVTVSSMLTQFQKEWWTRFTIPLVRLDSVGIQRIRNKIPTYHNPFYFYDKAIISVDTLKRERAYRNYLEKANWDIIVIDEAQHVADRGSGSDRARLARLLSGRSDTLLLLSATPHDGKPRSFASLMNMLDPTAIANPDNYGREDINGLFIRRFKRDVAEQVRGSFPEPNIACRHARASPSEEAAFFYLSSLKLKAMDRHQTAGKLFKTLLEKSLFSSHSACIATIDNRIKNHKDSNDPDVRQDIATLTELRRLLEQIDKDSFSKYQELLRLIKGAENGGFSWNGNSPDDRLVIFTERIETLNFLKTNLPKDLNLKEDQFCVLQGSDRDVDQQKAVEEFGRRESPLRLMLATDVASEGINLHFFCHRLVHFDIPWSLMTFQQRNGRIDRYGQENVPEIRYLATTSGEQKIHNDQRVIEILIRKDEQARKNIGDPSVFMGLYDISEEEKFTGRAIEEGKTPQQFDEETNQIAKQITETDFLALLFGNLDEDKTPVAASRKELPTLFSNSYSYVKNAIAELKIDGYQIQNEFDDKSQTVKLTLNDELRHRLKKLPDEIIPKDNTIRLSVDKQKIAQALEDARRAESTWPILHYLWDQHPVVSWLNDKVSALFRRHEAPVVVLPNLPAGQVIFVMSGLIPNRKGHPLIQYWIALTYETGKFKSAEPFIDVAKRMELGQKQLPNSGKTFDAAPLRAQLTDAVLRLTRIMQEKRTEFNDAVKPQLDETLQKLENARGRHYQQLQLSLQGIDVASTSAQKQMKKRQVDRNIDEYKEWVRDTMQTEESPFIQVIAVFVAETQV